MEADLFLSHFSDFFEGIRVLPLKTVPFIIFIVVAILLLFYGFISASEIAFSSLSLSDKTDIKESDKQKDKTIKTLLNRSEFFHTTILIWSAFLNVLIIVLCAYAVNLIFDFSQAPLLGFVLEGVALVFLLLIFGEFIPMLYVQPHALEPVRSMIPLVAKLSWLTAPLAKLLIHVKSGFNGSNKNDLLVDDLSKALELASSEIPEEKEMLEGIINLYNKTAVEIMTPRMDVAAIDIKTSFTMVIKFIIDLGYSRIPVYSGTQDNIKGILYIKDLLPYLDKPDSFRWQSLIRPAFFVPETKKIDDLLEEFRTNKIHLAVVVDEFGGTSGIVSFEDILEEIVGDINDEYDNEYDEKFVKLADGSYVFDARILLVDFFRTIDSDEKEFGQLTEDVETLAGLILEIKGDFPEQNEVITYKDHLFKIMDINKKRILKVNYSVDQSATKGQITA